MRERTEPSEDRPVDVGPVDLDEPTRFGGPDETPGRFRRRAAVFGGIWLIYLVYPLAQASRSDHAVWRVVGILALVLFAGAFLAGIADIPMRRRGLRPRVPRTTALLVLMLGLLALAAPAGEESVTGGFIYVGVLAVMLLPSRLAVGIVAVLAVASEVVPRLVPGWSTDDFFAFQIVVSCFAAWGVTQVIARNVELVRAREEIGRLAVADERARMSRDLHDILGHSLTVITVKAELAGRLAEAEDAPRAQAEIGDVEQLARAALADVRATIGGTRCVTLAGELAGARTALEAAGIRAELPHAFETVPQRWRELFAWTVREGVTNVVRHSGAQECVVRLTPRSVEVVDDGRGPSRPAVQQGISGTGGRGLSGLRERVDSEGGRLSVGSGRGSGPEGGGFVLRVEVPA